MNEISNYINNKYKLEWQTPVITEKHFYDLYKKETNYIGIPWAALIDNQFTKKINNVELIFDELKLLVENEKKKKKYFKIFTCCQHIRYYQLLDIWKQIGINVVYLSHKVNIIEKYNSIKFYACPLYAANIEDPLRNQIYINNKVNLINKKRKYVVGFQGTYTNSYISDIRKRIFEFKWPNDYYIKKTKLWHYQVEVYGNRGNKSNNLTNQCELETYNQLLLDSRFSLCPSGTGPNSIRLWEALAFGSIPIVLADSLDLPENEYWDISIIRVLEKDLNLIPNILENITPEMETQMRKNCLFLYDFYKNNYIPNQFKTNLFMDK